MAELDVAIVGAGFAGLSAALVLARHGLHVTIVEATEQVGGRARTIHAHTGVPAELGPEYVHGEPEITLRLLGEAGLEREKLPDRHHLRRDGRLVEQPSFWRRFSELLRHAPGEKRDISARDYMRRERMHGDDAAMFAMLVEGFYAAPLADISVASIAADASTGGDDEAPQTRPATGYGPLAESLRDRIVRAGGEIRYHSVVRAIDWHELHTRVRVGDTLLRARRVIVTVPLGVLLANDVCFHPDLGAHADALTQLAMGQVVKVVLCLRAPVWRDAAPSDLAFVHRGDGAFPTFWVRSTDHDHLLTAWAGGPHARALAGCTQHQLVERVVDEFADTLGLPRGALEAAILHEHFLDYAHDPFARGAYSYTRVHGLGAADVLARPLADKVFLAGELTDAEYEGSVARALASGARAARQVLDAERTRAAFAAS
jgi:monoamine oxidase